MHKVLQLKLINYLLEDESKFEIYGNTLLEKVRKFCENSQITKSITNKIYDEYENLKKEIKKEKDKTKWTKAYPNKLKKQATHLLLGKSKLKSLAAKDEKTIARMAADNKLTVPDLKVILKYKLENEYFNKHLSQKWKEHIQKHINVFNDDIKIFYDSKQDSNNRENKINNIYDAYIRIKKIILGGECTFKIKVANYEGPVTLSTYEKFKNEISDAAKKYKDLLITAQKQSPLLKEWGGKFNLFHHLERFK